MCVCVCVVAVRARGPCDKLQCQIHCTHRHTGAHRKFINKAWPVTVVCQKSAPPRVQNKCRVSGDTRIDAGRVDAARGLLKCVEVCARYRRRVCAPHCLRQVAGGPLNPSSTKYCQAADRPELTIKCMRRPQLMRLSHVAERVATRPQLIRRFALRLRDRSRVRCGGHPHSRTP